MVIVDKQTNSKYGGAPLRGCYAQKNNFQPFLCLFLGKIARLEMQIKLHFFFPSVFSVPFFLLIL